MHPPPVTNCQLPLKARQLHKAAMGDDEPRRTALPLMYSMYKFVL